MDCVGLLPKTKSGNEYLLTITCASTRFPERIPLNKGVELNKLIAFVLILISIVLCKILCIYTLLK